MSNTTTSQYQKKPDYFTSSERCTQVEREKHNTNPRYKFFNQTHFTAGDIEQFQLYRDPTNGRICIPDVDLSNNKFSDMKMKNINWSKYQDIGTESVTNTFNYMFHKFKKGIFIKVTNGRMNVFLPFSKNNFTNEWSKLIRVDPKYGDLNGFIRYIQLLEGRKFFPNRVNKFVDSWYANNCLLRYEFPISEGDTNNPNMSDMFRTLCEERVIPDMEFFINRRDFPVLKTDGTEPYSHIYNTSNKKLLSHSYDKYCPILSMVTSKNYADIPIPTGDDWARVMRREGKYFSRTCNRDFEMVGPPWEERKSMAVFRGGSTGCGVTPETNDRLKIALISSTRPTDDDGTLLLDAGITNWNLRPRKLKGEKYLQTIDIKKLPFGLVNRLSPNQQAHYKYIINLDGHVTAYRLSVELSSGSCILMSCSKYKLWYSSLLKPWVHFVPLKTDLSDLLSKIKWCKRNDDKCRQIAENAKKFAQQYLTKDGILDYLQKLLFDLKKANGVYFYNSVDILTLQYKKEYEMLQQPKFYPDTDDKKLSLIPNQRRSYGLFQGIEWVINKLFTRHQLRDNIKSGQKLFGNNNTLITQMELGGYQLVKKSVLNKSRHQQIIHEAFVTSKATNQLLTRIPNFAYVFGLYEDNDETYLLLEHIQGQTLQNYIHSEDFNLEDYCLILIQLALALQIAQQSCGFVHYDLTPWNIMIQRLPEQVEFDYIIDHNTVYHVKTDIVPIIIDMGRSHIIHDNKHYGMINMFQTSTIQDIITVLVTSIYEISSKNNHNKSLNRLIPLANFLSGGEYHPKKFKLSGKDGLGELRYFFRQAKKYSQLIMSDKFQLENKTPLDFIRYVMKNLEYKFPIKINNKKFHHFNTGNARQVYDYSFASNDQDRAITFAVMFNRVRKCQLPVSDNLLVAYYSVQTLYDNLSSVYHIMMSFLATTNLDTTKYTKLYKKTLHRIEKQYSKILSGEKMSSIQYELPVVPKLNFTIETFLNPREILQLVIDSGRDNLSDKYIEYRHMIEHTLVHDPNLPYSLPKDVRKFYQNNFSQLLNANITEFNTNIASTVSLHDISLKLYSVNIESLKEKINSESGDCHLAQRLTDIYENVIEEVRIKQIN